jgi:FlaA1/EpsC-like NDP-sugar epimerase
VVLRLGNVLGTEGSVSETFLRQITGGGPITITDRDAQRYFLTCEEAVDLLLASSIQVTNGAILVPGLERQYSIASLADFLLAAKGHVRTIPVEQIGMRSGDKPFEKLWSGEEEPMPVEDRGYLELNRSNSYAYRENLATSLAMLKTATIKRDLVTAMGIVRNLVPEYEPSARMLALLQSSSLEARALRGLQV